MADYKLFTSCLWQTTSAVVSTDDRLYLFDPAYFPHEIEAIADYVQSVRDGRELVLVLTHGDWDHIAGYPRFPDARLIGHKQIASPERLAKQLRKTNRFDGSYYVHRPYELVPPLFDKLVEQTEAWEEVKFLPVPGHKQDQLATLFCAQKLLVAGDMLSNLEFPFIADSSDYAASLAAIQKLVEDGEIAEVVPGHGVPAKGREEIMHRIRRDQQYLHDTRTLIFEGVAAGLDEQTLTECFGQICYDGQPINEHLRDAHEQNRVQLMKEAKSLTG
ncbi:MBL fold metallo-hydrolase [Brevibacillus sp. NSP2.1]|uniref:MBL fold metallo-hydrolase n=1 Tax=Brevibacillus sp. NSP2.1 TaxID=3003229 RepID=UPI0003FA82ED|nr:MBL fold metallo-hydrolase [Brevibacillus sp. NSP2.1]QHZ55710.1 MBL fold metallo-hydrolase [Brevibacillus sp. NSP2.1]